MTIHTANVQLPPSARWALASLSLSMLMSSLGTSIANARTGIQCLFPASAVGGSRLSTGYHHLYR